MMATGKEVVKGVEEIPKKGGSGGNSVTVWLFLVH